MMEMQTLLAECLDMERGIPKRETGKKHLERTDFIIAKQREEMEQAKTELLFIESENKAKEIYRHSLDHEITKKEKQLKDERKAKVDSILNTVGSFVGVGKSAAVEKENSRLKAENERIRKDIENTVRSEVEKQTRILAKEKQNAEAERDRALAQNRSLTIEKEKAVRLLQEQKADEQRRISLAVSQTTAEKDNTIRMLKGALRTSKDILNVFADILYKASEVFKAAIDAIISFGTEQHKSVFAPPEAADIKSVMQDYGETTEQKKAVGVWLCDYAEHRHPFDEIKRPIGHFAGWDMPSPLVNTGVPGVSKFWESKSSF